MRQMSARRRWYRNLLDKFLTRRDPKLYFKTRKIFNSEIVRIEAEKIIEE